jgi:hypothetical protein
VTAASTPAPANRRWSVAEEITHALRERYGRYLQAVGVHGALAHGDDTEASAVDLVVVTRSPGAGPPPGTRRVDGVIVDLGVIAAAEYLRHASTLTTSWPLTADQYITSRGLHDPDAWLPRLRDTHLARLAGAEPGEFAALAREAWCRAARAQATARRLVEWHEMDAAMVVLAEARLAVAMVEGLLARTYFRDSADAVRSTGLAAAHLYELGELLRAQADRLAALGRPVDGGVDDLLP